MTQKLTAWDGIEDEVAHCIVCGRRIWKFWYDEKKGDNRLRGDYRLQMEKCANCFFRR